MSKKSNFAIATFVVALLGAAVVHAQDGEQSEGNVGNADSAGNAPTTLPLNLYGQCVRSILLARAAEKKGDTMSAAQNYGTAVSLFQSTAPRTVNEEKVIIADEPLPSIGRRMIYYRIKLLHEQLAKPQPDINPQSVVADLRRDYGKMAFIEPNDPTWKYLDALASSADGDYKTGFRLCRDAATSPGGEESVRQKARTLANHIKSGALEQEQMKEEDQAAYEEYVRSGAQALDFGMVSAQTSAQAARQRGDNASADMWQQRYEEMKRQREQIKIK
jgi:hypothetical protein